VPTARRARRLSAGREAVWDVVSDPYHLPRWWPRVSRVESVAAERWTKVFGTRKGKSVRADERLLDSDPLARRSWTQELEESPFERILRESVTTVELEPDVTVQPFTALRGATRVAAGTEIGSHAVVIDAVIGARATLGPFCYVRPGTVLEDETKAGTFVEIKNSRIGARTKVPHLSYIGDADVGPGTNLGASTITANYDGRAKHRTTIGANVRTSVDTTLVAPVEVGDEAYTGAGSVITDDVPPGALGIARERQTNIANYAEKRAK